MMCSIITFHKHNFPYIHGNFHQQCHTNPHLCHDTLILPELAIPSSILMMCSIITFHKHNFPYIHGNFHQQCHTNPHLCHDTLILPELAIPSSIRKNQRANLQ